MHSVPELRPAVIGLGYVGLPLAVALGSKRETVGFDISAQRVAALREGHDATREVNTDELAGATMLTFSNQEADIRGANFYIVAVPTPINAHKQPDLDPLLSATRTVARVLSPGDFVVFESTVYPGATEEDCVPVLEEISGLVFNRDFFVGYSPERVNPGDRERRLASIRKLTSGSTPEAAQMVDGLYNTIIEAGTYCAPSIRVAEAAKVIENTQRDINIALINELAIICNRMEVDTEEVLAAAGTKWNFLPFRPGLVGGHCIGVDPYYLTHKAQALGYHPEIILAGRRLNDGMGAYAAGRLVKEMLRRRIHVNGARVLTLGMTFKENCPDLRNTGVMSLVRELQEFGMTVDIHDPLATADDAKEQYDVSLVHSPMAGSYDAVILAVPHDIFRERSASAFRGYGKPQHVLYDLKSVFEITESDLRL